MIVKRLLYIYVLKNLNPKVNNMPNLNDFPTDNSSSTNLKYDIIAGKFMNGVERHQRQTAPTQSSGTVFYIIGAVLELG